MIRISKPTRRGRVDVILLAAEFFGKTGEGLDETERGNCCISFSGAGGYVTVSILEEGDGRSVEVESREFDYQAKRFMEKI